MFFGHIAVGLAVKPVAPKAPLGALLVSATAIDTLWGVFAIAGIETMPTSEISSVPWSHGLFMAAVPELSLLPVFATVLLLPLGNWVDRHRSFRHPD
jgi:hypothetical protein